MKNPCFPVIFVMLSAFILLQRNYFLKKMTQELQSFHSAAVVSNSPISTNIGLGILKKGGSAADAAIAVLLSEGVNSPQSMGLGGGFIMAIYKKDSQTVEILNSRERAPEKAHKDMFSKDRNRDISEGGLAVAVPAELKGYWELHQKYGKLSWKELFQPTIKQCRSGITLTKYTAGAFVRMKRIIEKSETLREKFINKKTGDVYKEGELIYRTKLADTLTEIALNGPDVLYNGALTEDFLKDIVKMGGIITSTDLKTYQARWQKPISMALTEDLIIYSTPPPGSGSILFTILESITRLLPNDMTLFWHRVIEVCKFAFGLKSRIGGPKMDNKERYKYDNSFVDHIMKKLDDSKTYHDSAHYTGHFMDAEDKGTCHVCILAPNGDAISVTSTINDGFGAAFMSPSTGILLNNEMMDFSIPFFYPWDMNPANFIEPLKQPMSSMCPSIIINKKSNSVRMIVGGAGGFRILTATSQVIARNILLKENLYDAVANPRLHHQLIPMRVEFEDTFDETILKGLKRKGHNLRIVRTKVQTDEGIIQPILPSVNAICMDGNLIYAVGDPRRYGSGEGY